MNIAATLMYNTPLLVAHMRDQIPGIWIVDNGSTPPVEGAVFRLPENRLFTGGWIAFMDWVAQSRAEWVWMLNSDVEGVEPLMPDGLLTSLAAYPRLTERCAAITPYFNSPHATFHQQQPYGKPPREVNWIDWCGPLVNVEAWRDVGGFDPDFKGYGADIDFCYRARQRGWKFFVDDDWGFIHLGSMTALQHALQGEQGNVAEMDRLLYAKHGKHWHELV